MTPEEMDALYPTMRPLMSVIISDAIEWLAKEWTAEELIFGRVLVLPLDSARCTILVNYFDSLGWNVVGHVGEASIKLLFMQ